MSTTKVVYSPKIQNTGKMNQKQLDAIAELKKYFPSLSSDLIINGNLNLADRYITKLPDDLTINGSLDLRKSCYMERFPENLTINGNLYTDCSDEFDYPVSLKVQGQISELEGSKIPDNFTVGGDLVVGKYTSCLPDNLTVGGSLDLSDTEITELPLGLKVYGNLCLNELPITSLPADLYVGGKLECYKTQIKNIPETVFIGGGLCIACTQIRALPKQIKEVNGDLSITECKIKYLPNNLIIHGSLCADNSALAELPNNLRVDNDLHVDNTVIEELPADLVVGGSIHLRNCPIEKLPAGLTVNGHLALNGTLVKELPEGLIVNDWLHIGDSEIKKLPAFVNAGTLELLAGRVPVDIIPENFSLTGNLRLCVYGDKKPEPLNLPANMKIGGDLNMLGSRQKEWPKNLFVGGNVCFGDSDIMRLPTDATIKGKMILHDGLHYGASIVLRLVASDSDIPYSVVISKHDLRLSRPIFSSVLGTDLEDRLREYSEDKTKVEILPPFVDDKTKGGENVSARRKKKDAPAKA